MRPPHRLRVLAVMHALFIDAPPPGAPSWAESPCVINAASSGLDNVLVTCDSFGRIDNGRFTSLPTLSTPGAVAHVAW